MINNFLRLIVSVSILCFALSSVAGSFIRPNTRGVVCPASLEPLAEELSELVLRGVELTDQSSVSGCLKNDRIHGLKYVDLENIMINDVDTGAAYRARFKVSRDAYTEIVWVSQESDDDALFEFKYKIIDNKQFVGKKNGKFIFVKESKDAFTFSYFGRRTGTPGETMNGDFAQGQCAILDEPFPISYGIVKASCL